MVACGWSGCPQIPVTVNVSVILIFNPNKQETSRGNLSAMTVIKRGKWFISEFVPNYSIWTVTFWPRLCCFDIAWEGRKLWNKLETKIINSCKLTQISKLCISVFIHACSTFVSFIERKWLINQCVCVCVCVLNTSFLIVSLNTSTNICDSTWMFLSWRNTNQLITFDNNFKNCFLGTTFKRVYIFISCHFSFLLMPLFIQMCNSLQKVTNFTDLIMIIDKRYPLFIYTRHTDCIKDLEEGYLCCYKWAVTELDFWCA